MTYKAFSDEISEREIEAVGVYHQNNNWYLIGYCLLRNDYRQFRTDRILSISPSHKRFSKQHLKLGDILQNKQSNFQKIKVRLLVNTDFAKYISNSKYSYGFVSQKETEKGVEMLFNTIEISEFFPRWILSYGDYIKILEPEELKENARRILLGINNSFG